MASRRRRPPSTVACAPMGTWHPPPSAASRPRSAVTAACVAGWSSAAQASNPAPLARVSMASAPWPTAGHITSGGRISAMRPPQPRRFKPAAASRMASYWPSSSLRRRVSRLPRTDSTVRSGRSWRSCAARRSELVPTLAPGGQLGQRAAHHGVARVLALGHGGQHQALRAARWADPSGCAPPGRRGRRAGLPRSPW